MRLLSQLERAPGAGILFSGNTGKVLIELYCTYVCAYDSSVYSYPTDIQ